jgi:DNA-binding transcriptional MocR family regulator
MPSSQRPINLLRGWPSPTLLPAPLLSAAAQRLLADPAIYTPALQYGPDPGYQPLREALAGWLGRFYRSSVPEEETTAARICITGGASQSVANVLATFTDPVVTKAVWVVAPCYYLACPIYEDAGFHGRLRATPEDDEGIDIKALEKSIQELEEQEKRHGQDDKGSPFKNNKKDRKFYRHVIYIVATCANPSGKTMSLSRRESLVRLARKYDALIISDDVYEFLQWSLAPSTAPVAPLPRLCDIDHAMGIPSGGFGNAISNASFSKIAGPGVRTGWVQASEAFITGLSHTGATCSGGAPSQLCAAVLSDLVHSGELEKYINETITPALKRRHQMMMDAIHQHLIPHGAEVRTSSLKGHGIYGGYFVWMTLDTKVTAEVVGRAALADENLIIGTGNMFEVKGDEESAKFDKQIRLCFSWEPEEDIVEGVERLGRVLQRIQDAPDCYLSTTQNQDQIFVDANK